MEGIKSISTCKVKDRIGNPLKGYASVHFNCGLILHSVEIGGEWNSEDFGYIKNGYIKLQMMPEISITSELFSYLEKEILEKFYSDNHHF